MGGTITFSLNQVQDLLTDAERAWREAPPRTLYDEVTGPGFWIVGDEGIYLMHNGRSHVKISGDTSDKITAGDKFKVVYAHESNPEKDPDGYWDAKRQYFGGDDGVNFLPKDHVEKWLEWNRGKKSCQMKLTPNDMSLLGPKPTRRR